MYHLFTMPILHEERECPSEECGDKGREGLSLPSVFDEDSKQFVLQTGVVRFKAI